MCNKTIVNCECCGVDFKPQADENICPPCTLDLDDKEAKESQAFFMNLDSMPGFFDLPVSEKRNILGINY